MNGLLWLHDRDPVQNNVPITTKNRGGANSFSGRKGVKSRLFPLLLEELPLGSQGCHGLLGISNGHDAGSLGNERLHDQAIEIGPKLGRRVR